MTSTVVISVRIPRDLKEEAHHLGIDIRDLVIRALQDEIRARKKQELAKALKAIAATLEVDEEEWIRAVKKMRESRAP